MSVLDRLGELGTTPYFNGALLAAPQLVAGPRPQGGVQPRLIATIVANNPSAAVAYLQIFDAATAGAVTVGTTTPIQSYLIVPNSGEPFVLDVGALGPRCAHGIVIAATTTPTGAAAPATGLVVNLTYS